MSQGETRFEIPARFKELLSFYYHPEKDVVEVSNDQIDVHFLLYFSLSRSSISTNENNKSAVLNTVLLAV